MSDYYLNDLTIFLHYQIQVFSMHVRILASGYKNASSMLHKHGLVIFQNHANIQNLKSWPGVRMRTEKSKIAMQGHVSPLFWYR